MKTHIYTTGTLTIKVFVHSETTSNGDVIYHGMSHVKTIKDVHISQVDSLLQKEIDNYLSKCRLRNCDRSFSWKFETY